MRALAMDNASMNHYEKQLYIVFKTFDVDNEEALDKTAVLDLCDALQLEDRGAALVDTLFERRADRVTFTQFRNGLLSVLGAGDSAPAPPPSAPAPAVEPLSPAATAPLAQPSDDDSSGREVAPKFVFGSKKYGRRSRPQQPDEPPGPRASSASRVDDADERRKRNRCRRSASAVDNREIAPAADFDHDRRIDREQALALCRGLRMDGIDRRLVERIFEDPPTDETTVGEFFNRLNTSLTTSIERARDGDAAGPPPDATDAADEDEGVPGELVVEAWESAGVARPRRLLAELGFAATALRPPDLDRALEDELRALPDAAPRDADVADTRALLLNAALALARLRLGRARRRAEVAAAERDKLRGDVAEANRRARLLAQDVDENHARIEAELRAGLRRAEARHAEAARRAEAEASAERERAAAERARLEAEVTRRGEAEARARAAAEEAQARAETLEGRLGAAEERARAAERSAARLAGSARSAAEVAAGGAAAQEPAGAALAARVEELRAENTRLRDRCDELCAELEARAGGAGGGGEEEGPRWGGALAAELRCLIPDAAEEGDSAPSSLEQGTASQAEATRLLRELAALASLPKDTCTSCAALQPLLNAARDVTSGLPPVPVDAAMLCHDQTDSINGVQTEVDRDTRLIDADVQTEVDADATRVATLEQHEEEKRRLTDAVRELESSLEQMRGEYERCEEYWSSKLEEERETFAEEQRAGDERLADLVAKISEYERQFAPALPTIDEKLPLEAQINDLQEEFAEYRKDKEKELKLREEEISELTSRIEELERRREEAQSEAPRRDYHNPAFAPAQPVTPVQPQTVPNTPTTPHTDHRGHDHHDGPVSERVSGGACSRCGVLAAWLGRARAGAAAGAREVSGLRARLARAEAAVRRLHSRLAAADLLVKDLYVENCQLARRRPL